MNPSHSKGPALFILLLAMALMASGQTARASRPWRMVIMDPTALQLSCTCVDGVGQRRYELLQQHLEKQLGRSFTLVFEESLDLASDRLDGPADVVIGKSAMVRTDAARLGWRLKPILALTDREGSPSMSGAVLVKRASGPLSPSGLAGARIAIAPPEDSEAHGSALAWIQNQGLQNKVRIQVSGSQDAAALALSDGEVEAAVVSAFLPPLLEGCGKLERGSVRILAQTPPTPFIRVFAADSIPELEQTALRDALQSFRTVEGFQNILETRDGFVALEESPDPTDSWLDWRGLDRLGQSPFLPSRLPDPLKARWRVPTSGPAMAGVAVTPELVIIPDKSEDMRDDIFRAVSRKDGLPVWELRYPAPAEMDYSNAPRATPVVVDDRAYVLGALGDLHCVAVASGRILWKRRIYEDFQAERLTWGASCAPLVVEGRVIVNPGSPSASLVALDARTGKTLWQTPGSAAAYAAFVDLPVPGGGRQVVGYDVEGISGWELISGKRLWQWIPPAGSDFNVTTPLPWQGGLLLSTENNGTRLHSWTAEGRLHPDPILQNQDLAPDTCTPVTVGHRLFAAAYGEMFCLETQPGLRTLWRHQDDMYYDHVNVIAGSNRVLVWTMSGDLVLLDASANTHQPLDFRKPFGKEPLDSMAHPAVIRDGLVLRSRRETVWFELDPLQPATP